MKKLGWSNLIRAYTARLYILDNPKLAAREMFLIMETSIQQDSVRKQETTKEFLIKIIENINELDTDYADNLGRYYTKMAVDMFYKYAEKKKK